MRFGDFYIFLRNGCEISWINGIYVLILEDGFIYSCFMYL